VSAQALAALEVANEVRSARARSKREIEQASKDRAGRLAAEVVLSPDVEWRSAPVSELLRSVRGFGPAKIGRVCGRVGVDPSQRLDGFTARQRLALAVLLSPGVAVDVVLGEAA
jgi:hypothetical protein